MEIIALDNKYSEQGYPVIAINPNDPAAIDGDELSDMKVRAEEKGFTFPYLQLRFKQTCVLHICICMYLEGLRVRLLLKVRLDSIP